LQVSLIFLLYFILQKLLEDDEFYRIRLPSNVLNPPGKDFVISSVRAVSYPKLFFLILSKAFWMILELFVLFVIACLNMKDELTL